MRSRKLSRISIFTAALALSGLAASALAQSSYDTALKNLRFRGIGPAAMGGRVDDIAVVESDPRIIYVGAAGGGLFKTVNGGATWQAIFEDQPNPSIGDIALAPSNPAIVYVGTGEANNRQSSSWGDGVYKSMDGGMTWTHLGLEETHHIGRIVVHPTDPDTVYVAALGDLWGPNKERGVFKSTDGGATWTQTLIINEDTGVSDIAIDPQSPNILYAAPMSGGARCSATTAAVRAAASTGPPTAVCTGRSSGRRPGWPGLPSGDWAAARVEVYRKNSNIVYALIEHATLGGVYRSEDKRRDMGPHERHQPAPVLLQPDPHRSQQRPEDLARRRQHLYVRGWRPHFCRRPASATSTVTSTPSGSTPPIPTTCSTATMAASGPPGTAGAIGSNSTTSRSASSTKWPSITRSPTAFAAACRTTTPGAGPAPPCSPRGSAIRTGLRCRAATVSTTASIPPTRISFTPNRRMAASRGAI